VPEEMVLMVEVVVVARLVVLPQLMEGQGRRDRDSQVVLMEALLLTRLA
jgi:hypothetical protein